MVCQIKQFTTLFIRICNSQEVSQVSYQTGFRGDEEGAMQNVSCNHSDDCPSFFTILDKVSLLVGWLGAKSELASLNQEAS
jgi:hypothetical protein